MLRFLSTALYEDNDGCPGELEGALITSFDPNVMANRAKLGFFSAEQLKELTNKGEAMGFMVDDDGVLKSDTASLLVTDVSTCEYVKKDAASNVEEPCGLIDVLLHLANLDAHVIPNWDDYLVHGASPVHIPITSFKVSNSSFNIYAPYVGTDDAFHTYSLVDIESNKANQFAVAVPVTIGLTPWLSNAMHVTGICDGEYNYFMVDTELKASNAFHGEAFCNYLAFQVSYYKLGLVVLNWFRDTYGIAPTDDPVATSKKTASVKRKTPAPSMTIEAPYNRHTCTDMMGLIMTNQFDLIQELCSKDEEAYITYNWLSSLLKTAQVNEGDDSSRLRTAYFGLRAKAKQMLLHFDLELLAQRLHIMNLGMAGDVLNSVLKGGGVRGYSCKRYNF